MGSNNNPLFTQPVVEIIKKRTSVRTYEEKQLQGELKEKIIDYFTKLTGPFKVDIRFKLLNKAEIKDVENIKLGTYGVIKGATAFISAAVENKPYAMEQLGYQMEWLVLYITSLGLGTCWMAGSFNRSGFYKAMEAKKDELVPVVLPVGVSKETRSILEGIMRSAAGSNSRKGFQELFFKDDFGSPLNESSAGEYGIPMEMVRLAPSASNKQPWRILSYDGRFHFYLKHTPFYNRVLGYDMQKIDMGIAMFHFEAAAGEAGLSGRWEISDPHFSRVPEGLEYIVSWVPASPKI